ncbi:hypothetical protein NKG05_07385 [Oerskovia sp. M15]
MGGFGLTVVDRGAFAIFPLAAATVTDGRDSEDEELLSELEDALWRHWGYWYGGTSTASGRSVRTTSTAASSQPPEPTAEGRCGGASRTTPWSSCVRSTRVGSWRPSPCTRSRSTGLANRSTREEA